MGMELFIPRKKNDSDESLARFVTRRLGRECLEKIAEPLVAGIHTSNPDNMSVKAIFPRFLEMERKSGSLIRGMIKAIKSLHPGTGARKKMTYFMSLREGMQQLVEQSVDFMGRDRIKTSSEVTGVLRSRKGYELLIGSEKVSCDAVVFSTPSYITKEIVSDMDSRLAERLAPIEWSSTATISIAFRKRDVKTELPGFGFIVPKIEKRRINAATWSSIKWSLRAPDDHLLIRCFVGGGHHEELVSCDNAELIAIVLEELHDVAAISATPVFSRVYRWMNSMPRYTVGHLERIAAIEESRKNFPGLCLIGCSYRGIGIGDCVKSGFDAAEELALLIS
jgi:oxygen-dependent protoporphyrinogen oxidase